MEVEPSQTANQEDLLYSSLEKLSKDSKYESVALTMEALFKDNLPTLVKLFSFYRGHNRIDLAANLLSNQLLKNFDLTKPSVFDDDLFEFARSVAGKPVPNSDFFTAMFERLTPALQEKLIVSVLERIRSGQLSFLRPFSSGASGEEKVAVRAAMNSAELTEFYDSLGKNWPWVELTRELLVRRPKLIHDHGLFLIDALLNVEKHAFVASAEGIERRSLNVMRRICVVELIPEFVHLIDKLDNRHCYRWIEKSLEFFTKYAIAAIRVSTEPGMAFTYAAISLLTDQEDTRWKTSLGALAEYKYESRGAWSPYSSLTPSPFHAIYSLLDELSRKLEWPAPVGGAAVEIEEKMSRLFELKTKSDTTKSVSASALNKQISFYGLAFFFQKLIELDSSSREIFPNGLVLAPLFELASSKSDPEASSGGGVSSAATAKPIVIDITNAAKKPPALIHTCMTSLAIALELWRKFSAHKDWLTIITKCLNNSKSDVAIYKSFLADYFTAYSLTTTNAASLNLTWASLSSAPSSLKRRISLLAYLFINEKGSFKTFFNELATLLNELGPETTPQVDEFNASLTFFKSSLDVFEPTKASVVRHFSKLVAERLHQILESKRAHTTALLSKNDVNLSLLIVILQPSLRRAANSAVYQAVFQAISGKTSFSWPEFFEYVYDIQILQDFYMLLNSTSTQNLALVLGDAPSADREVVSNKIFEQVNCDCPQKIARVPRFLIDKCQELIALFDAFLSS